MNHLYSRLRTVCTVAALCAGATLTHAADLVFGQIASTTNPASASNAKGMVTGIQAYFDRVNAAGGVNGNKFKLQTLDDGLQAPKMVELTQQLIADKSVIAMLGSLNSAGLAEVAKQNLPGSNGIALIAPHQGDKHIVSAENVFPLRSGYADEVHALLKEAKGWGKDTLAIVNMNIAFGPSVAEVATQLSTVHGIKVISHQVIDASPEQLDASVKAAVAAVAEAKPKAILVLAAGKPAFEFIKAMRDAPGGQTQIYGVSVVLYDVLVKAVGVDKARGIVLSQAVPYPFIPNKPVIGEFQADMKKFAPNEPTSFSALEGYLGAKIAVEAARRAGSNPTRASIVTALNNFGEYDLGGVFVRYSPGLHKGWGGVDLSIISATGTLRK